MKSAFGILVLTRREQRAIIMIVIALLAGTIARHYRDQQISVARSTPVETNVAPSSSLEEAETGDDESHENN